MTTVWPVWRREWVCLSVMSKHGGGRIARWTPSNARISHDVCQLHALFQAWQFFITFLLFSYSFIYKFWRKLFNFYEQLVIFSFWRFIKINIARHLLIGCCLPGLVATCKTTHDTNLCRAVELRQNFCRELSDIVSSSHSNCFRKMASAPDGPSSSKEADRRNRVITLRCFIA